jgi:NADH-quinone oxidoreductase subunit J
MVAAIALTLRHRTDKKSPNPSNQVKVKRDDRIRMVNMAPETKE